MRYTVCFNTGASVGVEADAFNVVHHGSANPDGSVVVQFTRSVPNPRFVPRSTATFGIDAEPEDVADDDWEIRTRNITIIVAMYTGVNEVLLAQ